MTVLGFLDSRGFFHVHTIQQFVRKWYNKEGSMSSEYNKWVLEYYTSNVSTIILATRMRVKIECGDF